MSPICSLDASTRHTLVYECTKYIVADPRLIYMYKVLHGGINCPHPASATCTCKELFCDRALMPRTIARLTSGVILQRVHFQIVEPWLHPHCYIKYLSMVFPPPPPPPPPPPACEQTGIWVGIDSDFCPREFDILLFIMLHGAGNLNIKNEYTVCVCWGGGGGGGGRG